MLRKLTWLSFWFFVLMSNKGSLSYLGPFTSQADCQTARSQMLNSLPVKASVCAEQ